MKQENVIRIFLVGLPLGLMALGIAAMAFYFTEGVAEDKRLTESANLMQKKIDRADLESYVVTLAEEIGERNLAKERQLEIAAKYLESSLGINNMGYRVARHEFKVGSVSCYNLEVELEGERMKDEIVIVGAHYDSARGTPGANDNGTGVAALLCLAHAFVGSENARTLRFVAFANEEEPHFQTETMGSQRYAKRCRERGEVIVAMLCLETLGYYSDEEGSQKYPEGLAEKYPSTGNFVAFVSNIASRPLLEKAVSAFRRATPFPVEQGAFPPDIPGVAWSDHWSFWQAGYPALMVTDTAPFRYPHYHEPSDTPDKVDFDRLFEVVLGLENVVRELANPSRD